MSAITLDHTGTGTAPAAHVPAARGLAHDAWVIARRGLEKAAAELPNYDVQMYVPGEMSAAAQKRGSTMP